MDETGHEPHRQDERIDRRTFVRGAGVVAAAAALGPTLLHTDVAGAAPRAGSVLDHRAEECPIDTVVVLMMENRSFDHYLGWLGSDATYVDEGRRRWGRRFHVEARNDLYYRDPSGASVATEALVDRPEDPNPFRLCAGSSPGHTWTAGRRQRDAGFLARGTGNGENAIGYYTAEDVPVHAAMAHRFTVADHHFSSLLGPTFPNRQYFHSGDSEGRKGDPGPLRRGIYQGRTIWENLDAAGVSCGYYYTDTPASILVYGKRMRPFIRNLDRYFEDCATGSLPQFVFIAPSFGGVYRTDNHPRGCINVGERFVLEVFGAFVQSPHWQRGAFTLFYDEWGGFFDHVRPPILADARASRVDARNFGQAGFRVPSILASPYARANFVDSTVYDHTSVLRFLEWRFLGAPAHGPGPGRGRWWLTTRDRHAHNYGRSLLARDPSPDVDLSVHVERPTPACGNEIDLQRLDSERDPFQVSEQLKAETDRLYPEATLTPWLDRD
jgi:phospholipase C